MTRWISAKCTSIFLVGLAAAGCLSPIEQRAKDEILFDDAGGTTWRNHFKVIADPAGSSRKVFRADHVSPNECRVSPIFAGGYRKPFRRTSPAGSGKARARALTFHYVPRRKSPTPGSTRPWDPLPIPHGPWRQPRESPQKPAELR